jgi:hypothetical protein
VSAQVPVRTTPSSGLGCVAFTCAIGVASSTKPDLGEDTTRNHDADQAPPLVEDQADVEAAELRTRQRGDECRDLSRGDRLDQASLDQLAFSRHIHHDVVATVWVYSKFDPDTFDDGGRRDVGEAYAVTSPMAPAVGPDLE